MFSIDLPEVSDEVYLNTEYSGMQMPEFVSGVSPPAVCSDGSKACCYVPYAGRVPIVSSMRVTAASVHS